MQSKKRSFCFHSRGAAYLRPSKDSANRVECKAKDEVFAFIPEVQPIFAQAKIVQTEWNCKAKDEVFAFIPEVQPIFAQAKIVQTEWNAKQKTKFLLEATK